MKVLCLGVHVLDVLVRPVDAIPEGQGGAYLDVYACHLTVSQFPRIDALIQAIVREGTFENRPTYSQKCR